MSRTSIVIGAWGLLAILVFPVFPHFSSPNELSRWLLVAALVEEGTVEVTGPALMLGPRFEDLADVEGRLYSNKAPGLALASLPGYLIARPLTGPPSARSLRVMLTAMRLVGATLPVLLLAALFVAVARVSAVDDARTATVVWILLFATPLFAYGLLLFSHALVGAALFGAWALLFVFRARPGGDVAAGALIGLAVASEYTAAIPALVLMVALALERNWSRTARVIAAGLPFAALLAAYHYLAFGSALSTPYYYEKLPQYRDVARRGFFGLHALSLRTLMGLLFDPARGLLIFSPVLLLAVPGFAAARRHLRPVAWWTLLLVPLSIVLLFSGYPNWHGGWNVGPRYIIAAVPFLALTLLFRKGGWFEALLAGFSTLAVVVTSIVFPFPPNDFAFPWASLAGPLLLEGLVAPNALHLLARPLAIAGPLLLVALATAVSLRPRAAAACVAGAILAVMIGSQWSRFADPRILEQQRSYIAGVYFEREGRLGAATPALLRRRALQMTLPPTSWPF